MAASTRGAGSPVGGRRVTEASFTWPSWPWSSSRTVTESSSGVGGGSSSTRESVSTTTTTTISSWTSAATSTGSFAGNDRADSLAANDDDYDNTSFLDDLLRNDNSSTSTSSSSSSSGGDLFTGLLSNFSGTTSSGSAANYTTEFSVNVNVSSSVASVAAGSSSRLSLGALPDLLEEDELMALWNCTNCFLLNYGSSGGIGASNGSNGLFNVTRNGTGDGGDRDDWMFLRPNDSFSGSGFGSGNGSGDGMVFDGEDMETTIYLIRVIVTAIVLGIVILATVIDQSHPRVDISKPGEPRARPSEKLSSTLEKTVNQNQNKHIDSSEEKEKERKKSVQTRPRWPTWKTVDVDSRAVVSLKKCKKMKKFCQSQ